MSKKKFILLMAGVQAIFAMAFMCHRNPDIHWCAIAPVFACCSLLLLHKEYDED